MISGKYLGELVRRVMLQLVADNGVLGGVVCMQTIAYLAFVSG